MRYCLLLLGCLLGCGGLTAQSLDSLPIIYWQNGSFEGEPHDATVPVGWLACEPGTTPDILPGYWGVATEASEGETYVGLIRRLNGTFESITQRLSIPIAKGSCYGFSFDLAGGATYSGYNEPLRLRIWGSSSKCSKTQLLFESDGIEHTYWKRYRTKFTAEAPFYYILIEVLHREGHFQSSGNILIDNLSPLQPCPRA
jgi:hypothetical protein